MAKVIAFRFDDNDFTDECMGVVEALVHAANGNDLTKMPKTYFVEVLNVLAPALHLTWSREEEWKHTKLFWNSETSFERIKRYLQIKEEDVYFDDELTPIVERYGNQGTIFVIDTRGHKVYTYSV